LIGNQRLLYFQV